jgi:D-xylose transport system ATP-binding protein
MRSITVEFPSVKALDEVTFNVRCGEVHALVGENGAGKSTLMKVLSGVYGRGEYQGQLVLEGEEQSFTRINDSERAGIAIIFQELNLVGTMSVTENVYLGSELVRGGRIDKNEQHRRTAKLLQRLRLDLDPDEIVGRLGAGKQQLVEIARALSKDAKLLILDEPTASLTEVDSENLLGLIRELKKDGMTCVYISHKLDEVYAIADRITVLRDGQGMGTFDRDQIDQNSIIVRMVGRELTEQYPPRSHQVDPDSVVLSVKDWTVPHPQQADRLLVDNVSLEVRQGEVVGIAGLMGAGRTELAMSLFGALAESRGEMRIGGRRMRFKSPKQAIKAGMGYVSEDRKDLGLVLIQDVEHNMSLAALRDLTRLGVINRSKEAHGVQLRVAQLAIKTPSLSQLAKNLSGGNQQKVIVGKWLMTSPRLLILDEPTRGIDVGAKREIYQIINNLAGEGVAILMISSELPEVMGMSDRIYVMGEGRIRARFDDVGQVTPDQVLYYAQGGSQ